jgi:hypothetical protein
MTNVETALSSEALQEYTDEKRLEIYNLLTGACTHLYSKNKLQEDKFNHLAGVFADLAKNDPIFMVQLTAWAANKDSKDLQLLSTFFNALSDADGTPFFEGSTLNKPNFRQISYALLQNLSPHVALRVLELCHRRFAVDGILNNSRHFPTGAKTAFRKYLRYRENNPEMLRGIRRNGLAKKMQQIYRLTHTSPSDEAAAILGWKQKDGREINLEKMPKFDKMTSAEIADAIKETKLSPIILLSEIPPEKITASVAKALLANCSGNQSITFFRWFEKNGFLDVPEIKELFHSKVAQANTAIDRIDTLTRDADEDDKKAMAAVRSKKRKQVANTGGLGKIFMHIDVSSSMHAAVSFAKDRASIIAECVDNPSENFGWGIFESAGRILDVPKNFTKEDFHAALYGVHIGGCTDCIALYPHARSVGAEIDIYVTDQGHNVGRITPRLTEYHRANPNVPKPKAAVIVDFSGNRRAQVTSELQTGLTNVGIPVAVINPDDLTESALVAQAVRSAMVGQLAVIEEIMNAKLPSLPKWWASV